MYNVLSRKLLTIEVPKINHTNSWFRSARGKKPKVVIQKVGSSLDEVRSIMYSEIQQKKMNLDTIKHYMYLVCSEYKVTLDEDWMFYNVQIGLKGQTVTPWSLLDVEVIGPEKAQQTEVNTQVCTKNADNWMIYYCVFIYRLMRNPDKSVVRDMENHLKSAGCPFPIDFAALEISGYAKNGFIHQESGVYNKMIAALDMMFTKFHRLKGLNLRLGTLGSREECYY